MAKSEIEKITLQVDAPKMTGDGLRQAKAELMAIDLLMAKINRGMAGLAEPTVIKKSATRIKQELEALFKGKPISTKPEDLAKAMGLDPKAFRSFVTQANAELRKLMSGGEFRNLTAASKGLARFTAQQSKFEAETRKAVSEFLQGGVRPSEVQDVSKAILSGGPIILEVPAASVQAVLVGGPIQVTVPGGAGPSSAGGAAAVVTGVGVGRAGGSVGNVTGDDDGPGGPDIGGTSIPGTTRDELRRRVTQTRRAIKTEITRALGALDTITETFNKAGDVTKSVTTTRAGDRRLQELKERLGLIKQGLLGSIDGSFTGVRSTDLRAKASLQRKAADEIDLLRKSGAGDLGGEGLEAAFQAQAAKLRQSARKSSRQAAIAARKEASEMEKLDAQEQAATARKTAAELRGAQTADQGAFRAREEYHNWWGRQIKAQEGAARIAELESRGFVRSREIRGTRTTAAGEVQTRSTVYALDRGGMRTTITATAELGRNGEVLSYRFSEVARALKSTRAEASAAGRNFFQNTAHVSAWAASVFTLYGALGLARASLGSLVQTGLQTARLGQVFRGVGGSASQLRDDVLALAAANGRDSDEALDSAIRWSRLGLTRVQVNEAVRVSLIAANVAELDAATATEKLQAIMAAYGLGVTQLAGVLGQLNQISNTYNVTNKDLLDGLSRVASVAKQVGIPLSELQGLIGATVGLTGQTGANIGNAVKSLSVSLSNPAIQKFLRQEFQIEVRSGSGDVKEMSQTLSELFVQYQALTKAEQEYLLVQVAGKTQASRVAALLDSYIQAQVLAINAQLNLNSAEKENAQIKATLAASLKSVSTEWQRLVAQQGNRGLTQGMVEISEAFRNLLSLFNSPVGSAALTGFLILLTALSARLLVTGLQMRAMGASTGFLGKSVLQLRGIMASLDLTMRKSIHDFNMMLRTSASLTGAIQGRLASAFASLASVARVAGTAVRAAGVGLITLLPEIALVYGATWVFNKAMEELGMSSETAQRKLSGFNAEAERAAGAANAAAQTAKLFATVQRSLPHLRDRERNLGILRGAGLITPEEEKDLLAASSSGQFGKANSILNRKILDQQHKAMLERSRNTAEIEKAIRAQVAEVDRLKKSPFASSSEISQQSQILQELQGKHTRIILEDTEGINDSLDEMLSHDTQHLATLERQKLVLESIAEIYGNLSSDPLDKAAVGIAADQAKLSFLKAQEAQLNGASRARAADDVARQDQVKQAEEELKIRQMALDAERKYLDVPVVTRAVFGPSRAERGVADAEAALAAAKSGTGGVSQAMQRALAQKNREEQQKVEADLSARQSELAMMQRTRERLRLHTESAKAEGASFDFGFDDQDRLANRAQGLTGLIKQKSELLVTRTKNGEIAGQRILIELLQHYIDLRDVYLDKLRLGNQLQKEEEQLIRSKIKEFQKSLITAGPGELLRKLAATQIGDRKMSSGQFFSMSPQLREELGNVNPERFSPEVSDVRRQREALGSVTARGIEGPVDQLGKIIAGILGQINVAAGLQQSQIVQTAAAAQQLTAMANSAEGATAALQGLQAGVAAVTEKMQSWVAQFSGTDGWASAPFLPNATGHAPGA